MLIKQRGITKFIIPLIIIGTIGWLGFQLFPIYMEQSKIMSSLESIKSIPDIKKQSAMTVKKALMRRFGVNDVSKIKNNNYDEFIKYKRTPEGFELIVQFQDEIPLFSNLYLISKFDQTIEFK